MAESSTGVVTLSVSNNIVSNSVLGLSRLRRPSRCGPAAIPLVHNSIGLSNSSATFETAGDNAVRNNASIHRETSFQSPRYDVLRREERPVESETR